MIQVLLLDLDLTAATAGRVHRICSAAHDVEYNGFTYTAVGDLLSIGDVEEVAELATIGIEIKLSGIDPAYRQEIDNNGFKFAAIDLRLADLPDNTNVITDAIIIHSGYCQTPVTDVDYKKGELHIGVHTNSIWGNLEKTPDLCRSSFASHSAIHTYDSSGDVIPDEFFKFVASTSTEEQWISGN